MATTRPSVDTPSAKLRGESIHSSHEHLFGAGFRQTSRNADAFVPPEHTLFAGAAKVAKRAVPASQGKTFVAPAAACNRVGPGPLAWPPPTANTLAAQPRR